MTIEELEQKFNFVQVLIDSLTIIVEKQENIVVHEGELENVSEARNENDSKVVAKKNNHW